MKVSLDLRVFNWLLSVDIKNSRIAEYEKAAYHGIKNRHPQTIMQVSAQKFVLLNRFLAQNEPIIGKL